jgi:lipopolysaccharide transport system permease protein
MDRPELSRRPLTIAPAPAAPTASPSARHRLLRDLVFILTWRDIKIRYKQSVMGILWAVFMPALIVAAGVLVRTAMGQLGGSRVSAADIAGLSVKALPWAFFVSGIRFGTQSLAGNANLITKINVPRIAFPVSAVLALIMVFCGVRPNAAWAWAPVLIVILLVQVSGLAVFLAVGNLFLRDVKYIVEVVLTFAIFFTPVLYEVSALGDLGHWLLLNPIAPLLEGLRSCIVLGTPPSLGWLGYSAAVSALIFAGAWFMFKRLEGVFADYV